MELDNLIFDRTQADVDRAKYLAGLWVNGTFTGTTAELAEWATDLKGAYNATDLNRVIAAMDYLNEYFLGLGYDVGYTNIVVNHQDSSLTDNYTWYETDIPTQNEMSIYLENVSRLRDKIPLLADTPETPEDMQLLTYQEANDIERILDNIERVLIAMENGFLLRQANTLFMIAGGVFNNA